MNFAAPCYVHNGQFTFNKGWNKADGTVVWRCNTKSTTECAALLYIDATGRYVAHSEEPHNHPGAESTEEAGAFVDLFFD